MDAGIIKSFKGKYKHLYCQQILHQFEQKINIEQLTIDYVVQLWFQVTPATIQNCWQKTDILFYNQELEIQESETLIAMDIFNNLPSNAQQLVKNLEDYTVAVDELLATENILDDNEIVDMVLADAQIETNTNNDSEEELEKSPPAIITITEAYEALKKGQNIERKLFTRATSIYYKKEVPARKLLLFSQAARFAHETYCFDPLKAKVATAIFSAWISTSLEPLAVESGPREAIVVSFRGKELIYDEMGRIYVSSYQRLYDPKKVKGKAWVLKEFYNDRFLKAKDEVIRNLQNYLKYRTFKKKIFLFTGHGEGGVFAALVALEFEEIIPQDQIYVITFGQPRIGDKKFTQYVESRLSNIYRITHADDYVPLFFGEIAVHLNTEYWIPKEEECDCIEMDLTIFPRFIYECGAPVGKENPDCNNQFLEKNRKTWKFTTAHNGPYFNYKMGECDDDLKEFLNST
ncbi:hypothetical protein G9A89_020129 [Geosiphon pyriformis]|nr:hypothetical protein G9A89_020129 [Geosiphon pyriformis]